MSLNAAKGTGKEVTNQESVSVTQSVPANMNKSVIRGALLKYKTLVPAGAANSTANSSAPASVVIKSEFGSSGSGTSSNPPQPPVPASSKPLLPRKPRRASVEGSSSASPVKPEKPNESSATDTGCDQPATASADLARKSILHVRRKSGSIGYVKDNPINVRAAQTEATDTPEVTGSSSASSSTNSNTNSSAPVRASSLSGAAPHGLLENMFGRRRASMLGGESVPPIPVTTPTVDDPDYAELNTLEGRVRILELHNMFAGTQDQSSNSGADATIKVMGEFGLVKCATVPDSYTDCSKSMKNRLLIREGVCEKLNRSDQWEPHHFILTHNALVYCTERTSVVVSSAPNSPEGRKSSIAPGLEHKLSYHRTLPLDTLIVAEADSTCVHDKRLVFRVLARQKSFYLRCETTEDRDSWLADLTKYIKQYQQKCIAVGMLESYLVEENTAPMRVFLRQDITECQLCARGFGIFSRRHHCRACGKCVCEKCSREKVRINRIDSKSLLKVCTECARENKLNRQYGVSAYEEEEDNGDEVEDPGSDDEGFHSARSSPVPSSKG